jgi:hypothetical protein
VDQGNRTDLATLLIENSMLAERLGASEADRDRVAAASRELRERLETTAAELAAAKTVSETAETRVGALREECNRLSESAALAEARARQEPGAALLAPNEVAALVERLLTGLGSRLSGLTLQDAELRLKVGVQKLGEQTGFVVPGPESPPEVRETLHEISVRFDRAAEQHKPGPAPERRPATP